MPEQFCLPQLPNAERFPTLQGIPLSPNSSKVEVVTEYLKNFSLEVVHHESDPNQKNKNLLIHNDPSEV